MGGIQNVGGLLGGYLFSLSENVQLITIWGYPASSMVIWVPLVSSRDYVDKYETSETAGFFIKVNSNHVETMYRIYQVNVFWFSASRTKELTNKQRKKERKSIFCFIQCNVRPRPCWCPARVARSSVWANLPVVPKPFRTAQYLGWNNQGWQRQRCVFWIQRNRNIIFISKSDFISGFQWNWLPCLGLVCVFVQLCVCATWYLTLPSRHCKW